MRGLLLAALALVALTFGCERGSVTPGADIPADADVVAFVDVSVVPMDRDIVLEHQTVVVTEGVITAVQSADFEPPEGAMLIDGEGRFLIPGLTEMHGHLPNPDMPEEVTENVLFLYVANGVTTVRGMQGNTSQLALRERIDAKEVVGPRLILGSPSMTGDRVERPEQGDSLVRQYHRDGFDLLKVHEGLSAETYDAIAAAANEVDIPFAGHVSDHVGLLHALAAGQTTIDHLDNYIEALVPVEQRPDVPPGLRGAATLLERVDESALQAVVAATVAADASVVPTMVLWETGLFPSRPASEIVAERAELRYMPAETVTAWTASVDQRLSEVEPDVMRRFAAMRRRILAVLYQGGARILLGTDSPQIFSVPGFSIHREMALYVEIGMTPYEVLASGTRVVADYFGERFGVIAEGARGDLVLVDDNPLENMRTLREPVGVVVNGTWISREEIRGRLDQIAAYYAR